MKTPVKPTKEGITLNLYVQPGAAKSGWAGLFDGAIKLRVAARPVEGEANKAVCAFLAKSFEVSKSAIVIVQGDSSRHKTVCIAGDSAALAKRAKSLLGEDALI
jgi:uncharacterized protein (TIGR00251 family)